MYDFTHAGLICFHWLPLPGAITADIREPQDPCPGHGSVKARVSVRRAVASRHLPPGIRRVGNQVHLGVGVIDGVFSVTITHFEIYRKYVPELALLPRH